MKLIKNQIHLWLFEFENWDDDLDKKFHDLPASKQDKVIAFKFDSLKRNYIVSHSAMYWVLEKYLANEDDLRDISTNSYGKPKFPDGKLHFNISHSNYAVMIAVSLVELGVDIELSNIEANEFENIASLCFDSNELDKLATLNTQSKEQYFYKKWTEKESFIKATGFGMHLPYQDFELNEIESNLSTGQIASGQHQSDQTWFVHHLGNYKDHYISMCSRYQCPEVYFHDVSIKPITTGKQAMF